MFLRNAYCSSLGRSPGLLHSHAKNLPLPSTPMMSDEPGVPKRMNRPSRLSAPVLFLQHKTRRALSSAKHERKTALSGGATQVSRNLRGGLVDALTARSSRPPAWPRAE